MGQGRVVMGLMFFPRGGSAYVVRYLSPALARAGWSVSLAVGSLGVAGEGTHAPTFFVSLLRFAVIVHGAVERFAMHFGHRMFQLAQLHFQREQFAEHSQRRLHDCFGASEIHVLRQHADAQVFYAFKFAVVVGFGARD